MEFAIFHQGAIVHPVYFGGDLNGPLADIPLLNRSDGGPAGGNALPNGCRRKSRGTDCARPGNINFFPAHAFTSSGWRKASELLDPPKPNEFDRTARMRIGRDSFVIRLTLQSGSACA